MARQRGTTTARGLGYDHQKLRAQLLPHAYGQPCELCGRVMQRWQRLDLDHTTPRVYGGDGRRRIVHAHCNRSAGASLGNRLRSRKQSRRW